MCFEEYNRSTLTHSQGSYENSLLQKQRTGSKMIWVKVFFFQNSNHTIYCIAAFSDFGKTSKSPCKDRKIYRGLWHQLHQFVIRLMGNDIGQVPRTGSGRQQPSHSYEFIFASEKIEGHCFRLLKESKRQYSKPAFQRNSHLIWSIVLGKDSVTF